MVKLKWPHMNENPIYVASGLVFNQLNFAQFVGGETRTILKADDTDELYGRLRILSKVAYMYDQCKNWDRARAVYFAIISIEEGKADWHSSFGHYDMMCPAPLVDSNSTIGSEKSATKSKGVSKKDFFCRECQKGECNLNPPHRAWVKTAYEMVEHYCVPCYKNKQGKLLHTPHSETCPIRK